MKTPGKTIPDVARHRFEAGECIGNPFSGVVRFRSLIVLAALVGLLLPPTALAQPEQDQVEDVKPIPILQGSVALISDFTGGQPDIHPIATPVVLLPIGQRWLFETRATFENDLVEVTGRPGFHGGPVEKEVEYAQLDFIANKYTTISVGRFLTPFGIFNERLYPAWIRNLQSDPLILPIGIGPSNASTGAMVRGGFKARPQFDINYTVYFSTAVTTTPVDSDRFAGGRAGIFVPKARLEVGGSFQHLLQQERSNLFALDAIWQPMALPVDIRWEYARSKRGSGYWFEPAYKLSQLPFWQNEMRRTQLVARYQQFFTGQLADDSLPPVNTKLFEFGTNYYFMDGLKFTTNYGRQFSSLGNVNVWTMGLTYRFVVPLGPDGTPR